MRECEQSADSVALTENLSLCTDGKGGFFYAGEAMRDEVHRLFPPLHREKKNPTKAFLPGAIEISSEDADLKKMIDSINVVLPESSIRNISDDSLQDLEEFIYKHARWVTRWTSHPDWSIACSATAEALGGESDQEDIVYPVTLAQMLTHQAMSDVKMLMFAGDQFYRVSNLALDVDSLCAVDIREFCLRSMGTYSRAMIAPVRNAVREMDSDAPAMLGVLRGLPPEYIMDILDSGAIVHSIQMEMRGIPHVGGKPVIPEWLSCQPVHRRVKWTMDYDILTECIRLGSHLSIDDVDFSFSDVYKIHERIVDLTVDDCEKYSREEYRFLDKHDAVKVENMVIDNVVSPSDLNELALRMGICVNEKSYVQRLTEGMSMFFAGYSEDKPVMVAEYSSGGKPVEIRGVKNKKLEDELEENITNVVYQNWFEKECV